MLNLNRNSFKVFGVLIAIVLFASNTYSQNPDLEELLNKSYEDFVKEVRKDYISFRDQINQEYADFMRSHPWISTKVQTPLPPPVFKETEPDYTSEETEEAPIEDIQSSPLLESEEYNPNIENKLGISSEINPDTTTKHIPLPLIKNELSIKTEISSLPEPKIEEFKPVIIESIIENLETRPQPQPLEPIEASPLPDMSPLLKLEYYGAQIELKVPDLNNFKLNGTNEEDFATGWEILSKSDYNNLLSDCLNIREQYTLPDWGYLKFIDILTDKLTNDNHNKKTLLQGYLLSQSGYKIRFAYDKKRTLHLLFATPGILYDHNRYYLDGEWYYSYTNPEGREVNICNFKLPKEQSIRMNIDQLPLLPYSPGTLREISVKRYPEINLSVTPNKNLINFFADYPDATLDSSPYSMWMIHGNTPVSKEIKEQIYPSLKKAVEGKTQLQGVQFLLKVAQSFPYEYDENIWGKDRTFWMEESWEYPYSDCEDHAINFSHMVRDILDLDVCLIYYPGHLSSCVAITEPDVSGDYIDYQGKRYYVCDPTFFYGGVGRTAPSNNNSEAILIPLKR